MAGAVQQSMFSRLARQMGVHVDRGVEVVALGGVYAHREGIASKYCRGLLAIDENVRE